MSSSNFNTYYENIDYNYWRDLSRVINAIRGQVVDYLNGGSIRMRDMIDVVNHIRRFPDLFPEWNASETAKLFAPPVFRNKKKSKGYFF